jgi:DNA adenine methylase
MTKPFLKWVGGKRKIMNKILDIIPKEIDNYYEPFLGGGSVFLQLAPKNSYLSDINIELINCYQIIKFNLRSLIEELNLFKNFTEEEYYTNRKLFNYLKIENSFCYDLNCNYCQKNRDITICVKKAALFIYLNKTCFRGLYRENKSGNMNSPFGNYKNPKLYDLENLEKISILLQNSIISHHSYQALNINDFNSNDLLYLDPPYDKQKSIYFTSYTKEDFDQDSLKIFIDKIKNKTRFVLSNSPTEKIIRFYDNFTYLILDSIRNIQIKNTKEKKSNEIIIWNF